jgi:hypothetical protein
LFSVPAPRQGLSALVPAHRLLRSGGARHARRFFLPYFNLNIRAEFDIPVSPGFDSYPCLCIQSKTCPEHNRF